MSTSLNPKHSLVELEVVALAADKSVVDLTEQGSDEKRRLAHGWAASCWMAYEDSEEGCIRSLALPKKDEIIPTTPDLHCLHLPLLSWTNPLSSPK